MIRIWGSLGIVLIGVVVAQSQNACTPSSTTCTFYSDCLEAQFPCGPNGYAIAFGLNFCNKFQQNRKWFSPWGKQWISATGFCLQNALLDYITSGQFNATTTCATIKDDAYASHLSCYTNSNPNVCHIPFTDWLLILNTVKESLNDPQTYEMMFQVGDACGASYVNAFLNLFI